MKFVITQNGTVLHITGGSGKAINPEEYKTKTKRNELKLMTAQDRDLRPCRSLPDEFLAPRCHSGFRGSDLPDTGSESPRRRRKRSRKRRCEEKGSPWVGSTSSSAFGDEQYQHRRDADFLDDSAQDEDEADLQTQMEDEAPTGKKQSCSHDTSITMDFRSDDEDVFSPASRAVVDDLCEKEAMAAGQAAALATGSLTKDLNRVVQAVFSPCREYGFTQAKAEALAVSVVSVVAGEQAAAEGKSEEEVESEQNFQAEAARQLLENLRLPYRPMPTKKQRRQ